MIIALSGLNSLDSNGKERKLLEVFKALGQCQITLDQDVFFLYLCLVYTEIFVPNMNQLFLDAGFVG